MVPSVIDYLLQLPEAMHFARVQELYDGAAVNIQGSDDSAETTADSSETTAEETTEAAETAAK